jgi:4,5-dihydroxyphthalate decarboxylase
MPEPKLTLAVEHYDRHLPLLDRTVKAEGIQLDVRHVTVESGRHERMLDGLEWDCAELSLSSYIMAITRGAALTAIPVFPRRLFSQSQMYVNTAAGISGPKDLIGKKVGLRSFQTTLSVLAKGDLQHEYGIPLDQVNWITSTDEPVSFQAPAGVSIERAPQGSNIETMLVQGEIDAYMVPRMPQPFVSGASEVGRLFQDSRSEEISYFQRNGFYPIMHLVAIKQEVADQHPEVTAALFKAFEQAKETAFRFYDDPNWSSMAWAPQLAQEEQLIMGGDTWPNGLEKNRSNLERFIQYELDQGLIDGRLEVEDLFHPSSHHL